MDQTTRAPVRPWRGRKLAAIGLCILALECSQILYNAVTRPDLNGDVARVLLAQLGVATFR